MRTLVAFLLLCCSAIAQDTFTGNWSRVRYDYSGLEVEAEAADAPSGPLFSIWHINGHGYQWQQDQIDAGYPVEPTIRLIDSVERNNTNGLTLLNTNAPLLSRLDGGPIVLRMNNIGLEVAATIPRPAPTEENWRTLYTCVIRRADGTLKDTGVVSPFVGADAWTATGSEWATSQWMRRLQEIIPNPTGIILRENNEAGRLSFAQFYSRQQVRRLDSKGRLVWAEKTTPPDQYADPPPTTPGILYRIEANGVFSYWWRTDSELDEIDLRAKEWVGPRRGSFPPDSLNDWSALENSHYHALYAAFNANSAAGWQGKLRTVGYGSFAENLQNDAASLPMYLGFYRSADLTTPGAYSVEDFSGQQWAEYSISVGNPPSPIYSGFAAGRHAVIDPESFAGLMSHVAWRMQSPGREVRLTYWDNSACKPNHLIFADKTNSTTLKQGHVDALTALGRADLLELTIEDYELAVMRELARIHDHPVINRYWCEGTTVLLSSPLNTVTATKVYATETSLPGERQTLLLVYTPCDLAGEIQVGPYSVPAKRLGYWLTHSVVEVQ